MKKYKNKLKKLLVSFVILTFISAPIVIPIQKAHAQGDWASNIVNSIVNSIGLTKDTISAAASLKEGFWEEILNVVAVNLAQASSEKMSQKIANWLATGASGSLFQEDEVSELFRDLGKNVLQEGLSSLVKFTDNEYDPTQFNLDPAPKTIARDYLPDWVMDYIRKSKTFTVSSAQLPIEPGNNRTYFNDVVTGVGVKEITAYLNRLTLDPVALLESPLTETVDPNRLHPDIREGKRTAPKGPGDVILAYSVGFIDCTTLIFAVNGLNEPIDKDTLRPTTIELFQPEAGKYDCATNNIAGGVQLARNLVNTQNTSFDDLLQNTFKEVTGLDVEQYIDDISSFSQKLESEGNRVGSTVITNKDPYSAFNLILSAKNHPLASQLQVVERLQKGISEKLGAETAQLIAPGTLPDKVCQASKAIKFRDGNTSETICTLAKIKNPSSVVQNYARNALESAFNFNENTATWQQALGSALINISMGLIDGGIRFVQKEITDRAPGITASIKGLGVFDWLNPEKVNEVQPEEINPNAWQSISNREIDFSKLIENINLTVEEAEIIRQTAEIYRPYPAKAFILDRECVLGPDFGYEARLRELVQPRMADLNTKAQTSTNDNRSQAYQNFASHLNKKLEDQINFVQQAIATNPWPGQKTFQDAVRKIREESRVITEINKQSSDKRNTASQLLTIRNAILVTKNNPNALDLSQLLTPAPKWPKPSEISIPTIAPSSSFRFVNNNLVINNLSSANISTNTGDFEPLDSDGDGIPNEEVVTEVDSDQDGLPDYIETAICNIYGLCDTDNYYITDNLEDSFNVGLESDWDIDGVTDFQEFLNKTHPKYIDYVDPALASTNDIVVGGNLSNLQRPELLGLEGDSIFEGPVVLLPEDVNLKRLYYLGDLEEYNKEYNDFLSRIKEENTPQVASARRTLARLVSQYLNIQKDISTSVSLQKANGELEKAKQKNTDIENLLDQCYKIFYEIDKDIEISSEDIPKTGYQVPGFGLVRGIPDFYCVDREFSSQQEVVVQPVAEEPEICDADIQNTCQAYEASGAIPPAGLCDCYTPAPTQNPAPLPSTAQGNFCFGTDVVISNTGSYNVPQPIQSISDFKYRRGPLRGQPVKFLRFLGSDRYGFTSGYPIYHRNPIVEAQELEPSLNNPSYVSGLFRFKEIFENGMKFHTIIEGVNQESDSRQRIQRWDEWKNSGEYPIQLSEGLEYSLLAHDPGLDSYTVLDPDFLRTGSIDATMYALDDLVAMDRSELLYCQQRSALYMDPRRFNESNFQRKINGSWWGGIWTLALGTDFSYWFLEDGTLQDIDGIDNNWDEIKCSDWYVGDVNDYLPDEDN